jgi:hypothetical protein
MKQVTHRELHKNAGTLVQEAARLRGPIVTGRGTPVKGVETAVRQQVDRPFKNRRILPAYQELLEAGALRGCTDSTQLVREGR